MLFTTGKACLRLVIKIQRNCIDRAIIKFRNPVLPSAERLCRLCQTSLQHQLSNIDRMFSPPDTVRGMRVLDREAFKLTVKVPALKINKRIISQLIRSKCFDEYILKRKRCHIKIMRDVPNEENKFWLLDPEKVTDMNSFSEETRQILKDNSVEEKLYEYDLEIRYKEWSADEILRSVMPHDIEVISSFSRLGHIAHMNLRDEQMQYKKIIGQVILDKNPGLKMVVNKVNTIDNEFRFFQMELMAGEETSMVTSTKENHCTFEFDFSKVYWNSRLSTEHDRIVSMLQKGDVIYDVFAGVGPFAVPAAKKGCKVLANDLNPESFKWLQRNVKLNKVNNRVQCFNLDGREFIKVVFKDNYLKHIKEKSKEANDDATYHIIMNLPALATEFLDAFKGLFSDVSDEERSQLKLPMVHCHCFSKSDDPVRDSRERIERILGSTIMNASIHDVRDVAPNKEMLCVSFKVPAEVLFLLPSDVDEEKDNTTSPNYASEPAAKKLCIDSEL
ncbi:tRNA (guanine(37)-N(1))-methyltransferase-like [Saccoglossus kowalevskii]|uniref:tRNA (guanine(37)-N1)-methyltransferase n=1 Tax=Saccoglossus kowalevskii TaxID=10224 RepID=A0ABM0GQR3_SACKO|nr:PREDICTED: tRNA (guanine(37)-N1)-methyltransferase-like [Saccoglossus kowalevskii]